MLQSNENTFSMNPSSHFSYYSISVIIAGLFAFPHAADVPIYVLENLSLKPGKWEWPLYRSKGLIVTWAKAALRHSKGKGLLKGESPSMCAHFSSLSLCWTGLTVKKNCSQLKALGMCSFVWISVSHHKISSDTLSFIAYKDGEIIIAVSLSTQLWHWFVCFLMKNC